MHPLLRYDRLSYIVQFVLGVISQLLPLQFPSNRVESMYFEFFLLVDNLEFQEILRCSLPKCNKFESVGHDSDESMGTCFYDIFMFLSVFNSFFTMGRGRQQKCLFFSRGGLVLAES